MFHVTQTLKLNLGSHRVLAQGFAQCENFCNISENLHSYQTLINDALVAFIQQRSMIDTVRQVIREELAAPPLQKRRRVQRLESA
jgi:hypothetical protein